MDILGSIFQIAQADVVLLYAPEESAAWVVKNRLGPGSPAPVEKESNLKGAMFLLIDLDDGTVEVKPSLATPRRR